MSAAPADGGQKLIATNPTAHQNYFLEEKVEAGIVLQGTEIKSIRNESPNLKDSFVEVTSKRRAGASAVKTTPKEKASKKAKQKNKPAPTSAGGYTLEAWIVNLHIGPYSHGNIWNHEPRRRRKLLLHTHQIEKMFGALTQDGKTIVPTRMYFTKGRVKVEIAIAKGKKKGDKRADMKKKTHNREIDQAMKKSLRKA